ncbi:hypothetical protein XO12_02310 [Marinitoga sp. 1154]|uniref:hypothetical protein n=1 Tax=Marinitoga sp. 1154 TaxID=1643335 RepID=UPI001586F3FA|nr:hypothetical protein [Marinitoga sp. 1154]NUU98992.1 hypothetical protein [Marinitoga sp. 1154]
MYVIQNNYGSLPKAVVKKEKNDIIVVEEKRRRTRMINELPIFFEKILNINEPYETYIHARVPRIKTENRIKIIEVP